MNYSNGWKDFKITDITKKLTGMHYFYLHERNEEKIIE